MATQLVGGAHLDSTKPGAGVAAEIGSGTVILNDQLAAALTAEQGWS